MKSTVLPDWVPPLAAWAVTTLLFVAVSNPPYDVNVNRKMLWLPPLLAVAWTSGFIGKVRFRRKFRNEYEAFGSPQLFGSPFEGQFWDFATYLFTFRFLRLGDAIISLSFSIFVVLTFAGTIAFLAIVF